MLDRRRRIPDGAPGNDGQTPVGRAHRESTPTPSSPLTADVLLYDDSRQFGRLLFSEKFPERVAKLGPEPLEVPFEDFAER